MACKVPFHRPPGVADSKRIYERMPRRQEDKNFYSSAKWLKLRAVFLARKPLCVECEKEGRSEAAAHVDHVRPRKTHPELAFDWANLQGLCIPHHNAKPGR
jgi:5-methylcytosine-specific restriction enzyme A